MSVRLASIGRGYGYLLWSVTYVGKGFKKLPKVGTKFMDATYNVMKIWNPSFTFSGIFISAL